MHVATFATCDKAPEGSCAGAESSASTGADAVDQESSPVGSERSTDASKASPTFEKADRLFEAMLEVFTTGLPRATKLAEMQAKEEQAGAMTEAGRWQEAEELWRQLLGDCETLFDKDNMATSVAISNLATVLQLQGKWQEAEELHRKALEGFQSHLAEDHPDTLSGMSNLANVMQEQGKWQEAEELNREALKGRQSRLGEDHPDTLRSMNNLALVLKEQGKWQEAKQLYQKALNGMKSCLGEEHPDTLNSMNNFASIQEEFGRKDAPATHNLQDQDSQRYAEDAIRSRWQAVEGLEAKLGASHPNALRARYDLAELLGQRGRLGEAATKLRKTLPGCKAQYGDNHPNTLAVAHKLERLEAELTTPDELQRRFKDLDELETEETLLRPSTVPAIVENDSSSQSTLTADVLAARSSMSRTPATGASVFSGSYPTNSEGEVRSSAVAFSSTFDG